VLDQQRSVADVSAEIVQLLTFQLRSASWSLRREVKRLTMERDLLKRSGLLSRFHHVTP
jgi:hypothetical protein